MSTQVAKTFRFVHWWPAYSRSRKADVPSGRLALPVTLFLVTLIVPWVIYLDALRMSVYRFVLIAMLLPCLLMWIYGKAGRLRLADFVLLLYTGWVAISLNENHALDEKAHSAQTAGIVFIETIGPYLLARCYIRDAASFRKMVRWLCWIVLFLLPFAVVEVVTGQDVLRELFAMISPVVELQEREVRLGLTRVVSVFEHPILYGVFTGSIVALVYLTERRMRWLLAPAVAATSALALSAGP